MFPYYNYHKSMTKKQVKGPQPLESQILNSICEYLELKGHCFWRSNNVPMFTHVGGGKVVMRSMPKYTPKGLPDITLVKNGNYYRLEVKRSNTHQSPDQKEIEIWIKQNGGYYEVVRGIDDIRKIGL